MELQDYKPKLEINGVHIITPKVFKDCGGEFREICRFDQVGEMSRGQLNHSIVESGAIKAFHVHKIQTDVWYLINKALIVLHDLREDSLTYKTTMRLVLENQVLVIPPMVAHGIGNPYNNRIHMIYAVDRHFNPEDEFRLPWDYLGAKIWEIEKG